MCINTVFTHILTSLGCGLSKKNHEKNWRVSLCVRELFHPKDFSAFFQPLWDFRSQRRSIWGGKQRISTFYRGFLSFLDFWLAWVTTGDSSLSSKHVNSQADQPQNLMIQFEWKLPSWTEHNFSMCPRIFRARIHRLPFPNGLSRRKHLWLTMALGNKRRHGARASSKFACEYWQDHQVRTLIHAVRLTCLQGSLSHETQEHGLVTRFSD